jgi:hypothetical protein
MGEEGGSGAESYDRKKAYTGNHTILSGYRGRTARGFMSKPTEANRKQLLKVWAAA